MDFIFTLIGATLRISTPILFAALGETIIERSGVLNLFTVSSLLDNIVGEVKDSGYLVDVGISVGIYLLAIAYIYYAAWRAVKFFKSLFTQRLLGTTNITIGNTGWQPQIRQISSVDWLKRNLPSFPSTTDSQVATKTKIPSKKL